MSEDTRPAEAESDSTPKPSPAVEADDALPDTPGDAEKLVPVSEAIRYRKRAQQAEQSLQEMHRRVAALEESLHQSQATADRLERRRAIDAMLLDADAIDLDAARLLTEAAVEQMDEPDVKLAVDDLRRHKPFLFHRDPLAGLSAMGPRHDHAMHDPAQSAAAEAASTGDRRDLLRYLRLKRSRSA